MITQYITTPEGLTEIEDYQPGCWVKVVNPTEKYFAFPGKPDRGADRFSNRTV